MEVMGAVWVDGDLALLVAHLRSQRVDINEQFVRQRSTPSHDSDGPPTRSMVTIRRARSMRKSGGSSELGGTVS